MVEDEAGARIARSYPMGLDLSGSRIAQGLDIDEDDARAVIGQLRRGIVDRRPRSSRKARSGATESRWWPDRRAIPRPSVERKAALPVGDA